MNPQLGIDEIADAILDGTPVDWSLVDQSDATTDQALIAQFKSLEVLRLGLIRVESAPSGTWHWGHLKVFERIGKGAHGEVYRAWDTRLDREVALKLLPADDPGAAPSASTVIDEGRLLARVRHPNVATIYGAERIDGRVGLWMEFVKGHTLEEALRSGRTFDAAEVARLGVELCHAVSAVHAAGLLHRDIKAQNVMLDDKGRLVLMDFGTGRDLEATDKQIAGTPLYLAPEVLSGGTATPQSETYSIGVVLFRLLTNAYPVSGVDLADLRRAHAAGGDSASRVDRAEIPLPIRRVLSRAIDADPARRHGSADELAAALADAERTPPRRRVAVAVAVAFATVVAGALGWNLGLRDLVMPASVAVAPKTPTIAVLPFRNASADPGDGDFIDGLTSEVINNLAAIDGLEVRSQTSSFSFKDRLRDLRDVAKRLNVDYVVEADVQRDGNRVRISARFVRIAEDVPLWSETYDRTLGDVFAVQDEISLAIVNQLRLTIGRGQRRYQLDPPANDLYFRALAAVARRSTASAKEAAQLFAQVIEIAPDYAPAHAGLAQAYAAMTWQIEGMSLDDGLAVMRPAAQRAIALDPLLPEALAAMGTTHAYERHWEDARKSFERALELSTGTLTGIRASYAIRVLLPLGEVDKAEELLTEARVFDPLSLPIQRDLGIAQFVAGRYEHAIANLQQVTDTDPTVFVATQMLARALTQAGRPADALAVFASRPEHRAWERWMMPAYVMEKRDQDIKRLFDADAHGTDTPHRQLIVYAGLRDKDKAFEALGRAIDAIPHRIPFILACPDMALLRGDSRLEPLRRRLNLR